MKYRSTLASNSTIRFHILSYTYCTIVMWVYTFIHLLLPWILLTGKYCRPSFDFKIHKLLKIAKLIRMQTAVDDCNNGLLYFQSPPYGFNRWRRASALCMRALGSSFQFSAHWPSFPTDLPQPQDSSSPLISYNGYHTTINQLNLSMPGG